MNKSLNNSFGMTLVELLAAIVIILLIAGLTFPILLNGLKTANDIQKETMLRDEADYLMLSILKDLYSTKESALIKKLPEKNTSDYYLVKDKKITGFLNNELYIADRPIRINNKSITLSDPLIKDLGDGVYYINFQLSYKGRTTKKIQFENIVRTVNDSTNREEENEATKK